MLKFRKNEINLVKKEHPKHLIKIKTIQSKDKGRKLTSVSHDEVVYVMVTVRVASL